MKKNMKKIEASSLCEASSWLGASYVVYTSTTEL